MTIHRKLGLTAVLLGSLAAPALGQAPAAPAAPAKPDPQLEAKVKSFNDLCQKLQQESSGATEADVRTLITAGVELGRPYAANLAVKAYLTRNVKPSPALMQAAADIALLAGDYRAAASRYRTFLRDAPPSAEASESYAKLMTVHLDLLNDIDGAYEASARFGDRFRQSLSARKFDTWFVAEARRRIDVPAIANRLAAVAAEQLPIEQERLLFWEDLDWMLQSLTRPSAKQYDAVVGLRKLATVLRQAGARPQRLNFYAANLEFKANSAGKSPADLDKMFTQVMTAGQAYLQAAPTAATLIDITGTVFSTENGYSGEEWAKQATQKRQMFISGFEALPEAEKPAALTWGGAWHSYVALPEQWSELASKFPAVFAASEATRGISFVSSSPSAEIFVKQSKALAGQPSMSAAVGNMLAAGDLATAGVSHMAKNETWHMVNFAEPYRATNLAWNSFANFTRDEKSKLAPEYWNRVLIQLGAESLAKSPAAFDREASKQFIAAVWAQGNGTDPNDKSKFAPALHTFDWVPWTDRERQEVFGPTYDQFKAWAEVVRKNFDTAKREVDAAVKAVADAKAALDDATKKRQGVDATKADLVTAADNAIKSAEAVHKTNTEALAAAQAKFKPFEAAPQQITALEAEFKVVMAPTINDINKAPDALSKGIAQAVVAINTKNRDAFLAAARAIYPLVRDYETKRTPYGAATLAFLMANRLAVFDTFDLQCEIIADQLTTIDPTKSNLRVQWLVNLVFQDRPNWSWAAIPQADQAKSLQLNTIFGKALVDAANKGQFWPTLFEWFRYTRRGTGWFDQRVGQEVFATVIDKKLFFTNNYRPVGWTSATTNYMWLVVNEFAPLSAKYAPATYFDDMMVEEANATKTLDWNYWNYGRDEKKKVTTAAAKLMMTWDAWPLGYNGEKNIHDRSGLSAWYWRVASAAEKADRDAVIARSEAAYGKTRFDELAQGRAYFGIDVERFDLNKAAARKEYYEKINQVFDRIAAAPFRGSPFYIPHCLNLADSKTLTDDEVNTLLKVLRGGYSSWPAGYGLDTIAQALPTLLVARGRTADVLTYSPWFWKIARDSRSPNLQRYLAQFARELADKEQYETSSLLSGAGLDVVGSDLADDTRTALASIRSKSLVYVGGVVAVPRSDPRYPIFQAQADYLSGRHEQAWEQYSHQPQVVLRMLKDLDPAFLIWLCDRNTDVRNFDAADALAKQLMLWIEASPAGFELEARAGVQVAYANIALGRQEYPRARALYERVATSAEYEGTQAKRDAELKIAEVDRVTRQYDRAIDRLLRLLRRRDRYLQTEAGYQMALIKFDQEEFVEANEYLDRVFTQQPDHTNARILLGKVQLKMKKLVEATEVPVGLSSDKQFIVPGRPMKIDLEDRNLAVVGASTNIEVRVWTDTGDEETFSLFPFGDTKTKFSGQLATKLGAAVKNDHILQVLGNSTVSFALVQKNLPKDARPTEGVRTLSVATDAELYASSGKILSREELEERALEESIKQRLRSQGEIGYDKALAMSTVRAGNEVKPGNPIQVRVIDLDRSVAVDKKNTATVRVTTSSGDVIDNFVLTETEPASGTFEGAIQTGSAQATASASDSEDGSQPNFAVSAGDYPAWVGLADNQRPKSLSVDLNDNVPAAKMSILANIPGRKLKDFVIQTSLNGQEFQTVGTWPKPFVSWNGAPSVEIVRYASTTGGPLTLGDFQKYFQSGFIGKNVRPVTGKLENKKMAATWDGNLGGYAAALGMSGAEAYVARFHAAFDMARTGVKTFQIDPKGKTAGVTYIIAVDGAPGGEDKMKFSRVLRQGVHRVEVFVFAARGTPIDFELNHDVSEAPFIAPCPVDMFDPEKQPNIAKDPAVGVEPAKITAAEDNSKFDIEFAAGTRARVVRVLMHDFETDAPAIRKITLSNAKGEQVLPTKENFIDQRRNQTLEIVPGDRIVITYNDPKNITPQRKLLTTNLSATYSNAEISACFVEYKGGSGNDRTAEYIPMRRFRPGDPVNVFIKDPDMDVSDKQDTVVFDVKTHDGKTAQVTAIETDKHSGVFLGKVFPVTKAPERASEIQIKENEDLILTYMDKENTNPGIPWVREFRVEQVTYSTPELRVYEVTSSLLSADQIKAATNAAQTNSRQVTERIDVTRTLALLRPEGPSTSAAGASPSVLTEGPLVVEVTAPSIATSPKSSAVIYAQTSTARKLANKNVPADTFDPTIRGTVKIDARPGDVRSPGAPLGYKEVVMRASRSEETALDEGRFTFVVPLLLGAVPEKSLIDEQPKSTGGQREHTPLSVSGNDEIFLGFQYKTPDGQTKWLTQKVTLTSDVFFDAMDRRYQSTVDSLHVGEKLYFRVVHKSRDVSDDKDTIDIQLTTAAGRKKTLQLSETFGHSGVFKGLVDLSFAEDAPKAAESQPAAAVAVPSLPVTYGDVVTASYTPPDAKEPVTRQVQVFKGADGNIVPFTKRFKDPAIAVQTQFTIAEAYFELAKKHRELQQEELSRKEIAQGRKLLEEAIRDYPDTEFRAQAEYLLANLSAEFAKDAPDADVKKRQQREAVSRFSDIVSNFPDSPYAPKSQYKKALVLEQMGEIDPAMEEYVKLSYRYPDNELVAETIARLGQYFLTKGKEFDEKSQTPTDPVEKEKIKIQSREMFKTAAQVFGRLAVRFPSHALAGRTTVLSAQCYMRAADLDRAIEIFKKVVEDPKMEKDLVAQSMYWAGDCYMTKQDAVNAYRMFKRVTWDYPETQWAKYARGRLTDEALVRVEEAEANKK